MDTEEGCTKAIDLLNDCKHDQTFLAPFDGPSMQDTYNKTCCPPIGAVFGYW